MRTYLILIMVVQLVYSCGRDNLKDEKLDWKLENENYIIENDTIYKNNVPVGIKVSTIKRLNNSQVLIIKALTEDEIETFHAK